MKQKSNFDSIKVKVNESSLIWRNTEDFNEFQNHTFVKGIGNVVCFDPSKINLGINRIYWRPFEESFVIELNAKLLRENYGRSINIDTFDQVIFEFNKRNPFIKLDPLSTLEQGYVLTATPCNDLSVKEHPQLYIQHLARIQLRTQYELKDYSKQSIGFKHRTAKKSAYSKAYDKYYEVTHPGKSSKFDKELLSIIDPNQFRGKLRIETDIKNFNALRKYLTLPSGDPHLSDVLNSSSPANYLAINEIIDSKIAVIPGHSLIDSVPAERDYVYNEYLHQKYVGDDKQVKTHLKMLSARKSKATYFRHHKKYLHHKLMFGKSIRAEDDQYIQEIMKGLQDL